MNDRYHLDTARTVEECEQWKHIRNVDDCGRADCPHCSERARIVAIRSALQAAGYPAHEDGKEVDDAERVRRLGVALSETDAEVKRLDGIVTDLLALVGPFVASAYADKDPARNFVAWTAKCPTGDGSGEEDWHFEARRDGGKPVTERLIEVTRHNDRLSDYLRRGADALLHVVECISFGAAEDKRIRDLSGEMRALAERRLEESDWVGKLGEVADKAREYLDVHCRVNELRLDAALKAVGR